MNEGSNETRRRLFRSARGLTCLFWTALAGMAGALWTEGASLSGWASIGAGCLYAVPLAAGLWTLGGAMAGMRRSDGYAVFAAVSVALLGLGPFWGFWRARPDSLHFSVCAAALWATWIVWLTLACWLTRRYARDLGDRALASEAAFAATLTALFGAGVPGLVAVVLRNQCVPLDLPTFLDALRRLFRGGHLVAFVPFLVAAYTLWLGKESGYKRLMGNAR